MAHLKHHPKTYEQAVAALAGRPALKLGNNTWLEFFNDCCGIVLHKTVIVRFHKDGQVTLHTGGYRTATTKDRINEFITGRVYQEKFKWYCVARSIFGELLWQHPIPFTEGMNIATEVKSMFDPTKPQPWDIYTYKVRPGFKASNDPVERDLLHAKGLGIVWSPSDTDLCEAQAEVGRKFATLNNAPVPRDKTDCSDCEPYPQSFYRRENGGQAVLDYDALVSDLPDSNNFVIRPLTQRGREWFSIHCAQFQKASGLFVFAPDDLLPYAERARAAGLKFTPAR